MFAARQVLSVSVTDAGSPPISRPKAARSSSIRPVIIGPV